jgi:ABC-2 type transport system permease protein
VRAAGRYLRLLGALARYGLARELAFRGNFLAKIFVEVLWLGILLVFYDTVFAQTTQVAGWPKPAYLFFLGCYFAMEGLIETFFLENCTEFAELIRTGDLDFFLVRPIDEQFLITCRSIDWSTAPNVLMGGGLMIIAVTQLGEPIAPLQVVLFLLLFGCGTALAYSFLLMLTSTAVWLVRNQNLMEMWWLFTSLMRYPKEIFQVRSWAMPLGWFFTFVVPVMLVINVPARTMVKALEPGFAAFTVVITIIMLYVSRQFFRYALRRYRSASS